MAMQGVPSLAPDGGHPGTGARHQERLNPSQETNTEEMVERISHMKLGPGRPTNAAANVDQSHHFELTESMSSFELDPVEASAAQLYPSALPSSGSPCSSCTPRSLSSTEGGCSSCSPRPLSSRESEGSFLVLRPNRAGIQTSGGGGVSLQVTREADVQYKLSETKGAGVDGIPLQHPRGCSVPPTATEGLREQDGSQTEVLCHERGRTGEAANTDLVAGGGVPCRPQDCQKMGEDTMGGYSPLNKKDERRGNSPSSIQGKLGASSGSSSFSRVGVTSDRTIEQYDVQCREASDTEAKTGYNRGPEPKCDPVLSEAAKGSSPFKRKEQERKEQGTPNELHGDVRYKGGENRLAVTGKGRVPRGDDPMFSELGEGFSPLRSKEQETTNLLQSDVRCKEANDTVVKRGDIGVPSEAGKGFGPLRSKETLNLLHSDDNDDHDDDDEEYHDILIIYHKKDVDHLQEFEAICDRHGWTTITKDEFPIGTRHFSQFEVALTNCLVAVALITSNFLGDGMAEHEHQTALIRSIKAKAQNFLPIIYEEGVRLPSYLGMLTCGQGYSKGFEKQFARTMKSKMREKQPRMNGRLPVNQLDYVPGVNQQNPTRQASQKPPAPEQDVPAMFRRLQGQLTPGPYAQRFFRDSSFRELCLVLDLCDPLGTPYWYRLAEHIGFDHQDIEWLDRHGRCAANVLEVYCCKHSREDLKPVLEGLRRILDQLDYIQATGIVGQELVGHL